MKTVLMSYMEHSTSA